MIRHLDTYTLSTAATKSAVALPCLRGLDQTGPRGNCRALAGRCVR